MEVPRPPPGLETVLVFARDPGPKHGESGGGEGRGRGGDSKAQAPPKGVVQHGLVLLKFGIWKAQDV